MSHECIWCEQPAVKRCSGCSVETAWYCGTACQKEHWQFHILDCKPSKGITTAHYLLRDVYRDFIPDHQQTRDDYGFTKALTPANESKLLGLYQGLMKYNNVSAKMLHKWRVQGILNQWVLDTARPAGGIAEEMRRRANLYAGFPDDPTEAQMKRRLSTLAENTVRCYQMCALTLSAFRPSPSDDLWIPFGFCACPDEDSEKELGGLYRILIDPSLPCFGQVTKCSFKELCDAFGSSSLFSLFARHGLGHMANRVANLAEVLRGSPTAHKSVWFLKQFAVSDRDTVGLQQSVAVDYGFVNCTMNGRPDAEKTEMLRKVYNDVFLKAKADPMKLHEAAIKSKIFEFVSRLVEIKAD
ncbi:uncharacterized protein LAESUDRAFT_750540 [Laetiporus sulphureus 93-53]|uniref:MYND-type domain-containing protein n=1 Tax=Laetiporus sulphureus 93-53 TaxID=1314785 RepID=A0A165DTU4_9APHY|nr:uncharacterized protein LAESUDRAFT_750540 [Laetiporus sulphureus 93-53]KZT05624.1 hypothetical protein LAESUDRAFT_750540 [Laetiporus sulphureus 93-53]